MTKRELSSAILVLFFSVAPEAPAAAQANRVADSSTLTLLAELAATSEEVKSALRLMEEAESSFGHVGRFQIAMGVLRIKNRDVEGAESAFHKAKEQPTSVHARVALGDLYLAKRYIEGTPANTLPPIDFTSFYERIQSRDEARDALRRAVNEGTGFYPGWAWRRAAERALGTQDYDLAESAAELALEKEEHSIDSLLLKGRVQLSKGDVANARQTVKLALAKDEANAEAHYWLSRTLLGEGNAALVRRELVRAIELDPNLIQAVVVLADLDTGEGNPKAAVDALEALVADNPRVPEAYRSLGAAYLEMSSWAEATQALRKFTGMAPRDSRGPYLLGLALRGEGRADEARRQFEASLRLQPSQFVALEQLVAIDLAANQLDAALERVRPYLDLYPESEVPLILLGDVYQARGEVAFAESSFKTAIQMKPERTATRVKLARFYSDIGRWELALAQMREAREADPHNIILLMISGAIHEQKGDPEGAMELYEKVLEIQPNYVPAANNLALHYSRDDHRLDRALELAEAAHEEDPGNPQIADTLGWVHYRRGNYPKALALLQESAAKLPDNPEVQYHLGVTYNRLGNSTSARQALERALELDPAFSEADEARRILADLLR